MEDYKEKYENALEWIKDIYPTLEGAAKKDAEHYFPELKESEDERIRKALLNEFIHLQSKGYKFAGLEGEEIVAWLEKRGEQKPAWSEEDEKMLHEISQCVYDNVVYIGTVNKVKYIDWLNSLKERMKGE